MNTSIQIHIKDKASVMKQCPGFKATGADIR